MASLAQFFNLTRHIKNWPLHFQRKFRKNKGPVQFLTTGVPVKFEVPDELYTVFKEIFVQDFYKIDELLPFVPENAVVVDVGANAGYFSMLILSKVKGAKIYAFEPVEKNFVLLNRNKNFNTALAARIHGFKKALTGSVTGTIDFFVDNSEKKDSVIGSIYNDFSNQNNDRQQAEAISLADFMRTEQINKIDLLKLDCEGSEYPILYETPAEMFDKIEALTIEVHDMDKEQRNLESLNAFLKKHNYHTEYFLAPNDCYSLFARKN